MSTLIIRQLTAARVGCLGWAMTEHHKDASVAVAQRLLDEMSPADLAQVQAEADSKGVSAVEIVRRSLEVLITETNPTAPQSRLVKAGA